MFSVFSKNNVLNAFHFNAGLKINLGPAHYTNQVGLKDTGTTIGLTTGQKTYEISHSISFLDLKTGVYMNVTEDQGNGYSESSKIGVEVDPLGMLYAYIYFTSHGSVDLGNAHH